eukprot:4253477-Pyramimonas_sp.AAC.1
MAWRRWWEDQVQVLLHRRGVNRLSRKRLRPVRLNSAVHAHAVVGDCRASAVGDANACENQGFENGFQISLRCPIRRARRRHCSPRSGRCSA